MVLDFRHEHQLDWCLGEKSVVGLICSCLSNCRTAQAIPSLLKEKITLGEKKPLSSLVVEEDDKKLGFTGSDHEILERELRKRM